MKGRFTNLGEYLKEKRLSAKLSQNDVANFMGYRSGQFVSNWERGEVEPPANTLSTLAKLYKIDEGEFLTFLVEESQRYYQSLLSSKRRKKFSA